MFFCLSSAQYTHITNKTIYGAVEDATQICESKKKGLGCFPRAAFFGKKKKIRFILTISYDWAWFFQPALNNIVSNSNPSALHGKIATDLNEEWKRFSDCKYQLLKTR